jgi:hypothetical protein
MTEFSEKSQRLAKGILLRTEGASSEVILNSFKPLQHENDLSGVFLAMAAWKTKEGFNLTSLCRFARDQRCSEDYAPLLDWIEENVLGPGALSPEDIKALDKASAEWVKAEIESMNLSA